MDIAFIIFTISEYIAITISFFIGICAIIAIIDYTIKFFKWIGSKLNNKKQNEESTAILDKTEDGTSTKAQVPNQKENNSKKETAKVAADNSNAPKVNISSSVKAQEGNQKNENTSENKNSKTITGNDVLPSYEDDFIHDEDNNIDIEIFENDWLDESKHQINVSQQKPNSNIPITINDNKPEVKKENDIQAIINSINNDLAEADKFIKKGDLESAQSKIKEAKAAFVPDLPANVKKEVEEKTKHIDAEYTSGIIPEQEIVHVKYNFPQSIQTKDGYYFNLISPKYDTVVFPYRRSKVELRGYTESSFENKLRSSLNEFKNYKVLGDVSILPSDGCHPYEPDIAIIEIQNNYGIRIDIEIDEPYSGVDKKPIHYIGCGDEYRDMRLANMGWIVIRFSETQIYKEPSKCIALIKHIISCIDSSAPQNGYDAPSFDKRWTETEAQMMAVRRYRETLMNHEFGKLETSQITKGDIQQTALEKAAASQVTPLIFAKKSYNNIDHTNTSFNQDNLISFEPKEHVYVYNGTTELMPVSTAISHFFEPFDLIRESEKYAQKYGLDQCKVMENWDSRGKESREVGTFLHAQIEAYLNGGVMKDSTRYQYNGEFIKEDKVVSISKEIQYFKQFLNENTITPFRTEWHIYDLEHKIAGTIDLICRNGDSYDIYDWKRSKKAGPFETVWRHGIHGLESVPDISFYHYALQQNIYKYILEKNYGIKVNNLHIVVLHPSLGKYIKYKMPDMQDKVKTILNRI